MGKRRFASAKLLLLLLTILILSHLVVCSRAIPSTRIQGFAAHKPQVHPVLISHRQASAAAELGMGSLWEEEDNGEEEEEEEEEEEVTGGRMKRMGMALNDYPGSGANNRHIPKPPART